MSEIGHSAVSGKNVPKERCRGGGEKLRRRKNKTVIERKLMIAQEKALEGEWAEAVSTFTALQETDFKRILTNDTLRFSLKERYVALAAELSDCPHSKDPEQIDRFCLRNLEDLSAFLDWVEKKSPRRRVRAKAHLKTFFDNWCNPYLTLPIPDRAERLLQIRALSDFVTKRVEYPSVRPNIDAAISTIVDDIRAGRASEILVNALPPKTALLKAILCNEVAYALFKAPGHGAEIYSLRRMRKANAKMKDRERQLLVENSDDEHLSKYFKASDKLKKKSAQELWSGLREKLKLFPSLFVVREGRLDDIELDPGFETGSLRETRSFVSLVFRDQIRTDNVGTACVVAGDKDETENATVRRELGTIISSVEACGQVVYWARDEIDITRLANKRIWRLYAAGHGCVAPAFNSGPSKPVLQLKEHYIDLGVLQVHEAFLNACNLGSTYLNDEGLWVNLPDRLIRNGAKTVIAPTVAIPDFWASGLLQMLLLEEEGGLPFPEAFDAARRVLLRGPWPVELERFLDQNAKLTIRKFARNMSRFFGRKRDPIEAMRLLPAADLAEWFTLTDKYRLSMLLDRVKPEDPFEFTEDFFARTAMSKWAQIRSQHQPTRLAEKLISTGYRVWTN